MDDNANRKVSSSFRDPCCFLFYRDGTLYRQINNSYKENYKGLINSGLYTALVDAEFLIPHEEIDIELAESDTAYKIIKPEPIPFISYPYEWCFSQLKDSASLTLKIQQTALTFGMSLKDCSAYNIQFRKGKPVFIDTLSFEKYNEGQPWIAYRQFCKHFLAPLALMSYRDIRLNQLFRIYIDGVPLDLASSLLPFRTRFLFSLQSHIHLHAKSQKHFAHKTIKKSNHKMGKLSFRGLIDNLASTVDKLKYKDQDTEWADYYEDTNYSLDSFQKKKQLIAEWLDTINPKDVWDLGANTGVFSRIAAHKKIKTISFDIDPAAVEKNYRECVKNNEVTILPLLLDLTNPSPGIGWENGERLSLLQRGPADTVFALALIHHLAISNNVPLKRIAGFFYELCKTLIIEFVPKNDSQVQRLLSTREDIFPEYTQVGFEQEFGKYFKIQNSVRIADSKGTLYLMVKR